MTEQEFVIGGRGLAAASVIATRDWSWSTSKGSDSADASSSVVGSALFTPRYAIVSRVLLCGLIQLTVTEQELKSVEI